MFFLDFFHKPSTTGIIAGILSRFTNRTDIVFGKFLLKDISPVMLAFIEMVTGMILMFFYMGVKNIIARLRDLDRSEFFALTICSLLSGVIGPLFFLKGLNETSGINTSILVNLNPLFMSIFAVMILKEEFTKHLFGGIILLFSAITFLGTQGFQHGIEFNFGDLFIVISALAYSFGNILFKRFVHTRHLDALVAYRTIIGSVVFGIIMWFLFRQDLKNFASHFENYYQWILMYAFIGVIITYILQYWALENTTLINNALIAISSPVIGILYSNIFLKEKITWIHLLTIFIIIIGVMITKIDLIQKALFELKIRLRQTHGA